MILLVGLPVAVIAWYVGVYLVSKVLGKRFDVPVPDLLFGEVNGGDDRPAVDPPAFGTVLGLLLIPLALISFNTVLRTLVTNGTHEEGQAWIEALQLLGNTPVALLVSLLAAILVLGRHSGSFQETMDVLAKALGPICSIILITGAGGMFGGVFGGVLRTSGIGDALTSSLSGLGLPLLLQAFLVATALRVAQGSATVALTTTAGLITSTSPCSWWPSPPVRPCSRTSMTRTSGW